MSCFCCCCTFPFRAFHTASPNADRVGHHRPMFGTDTFATTHTTPTVHHAPSSSLYMARKINSNRFHSSMYALPVCRAIRVRITIMLRMLFTIETCLHVRSNAGTIYSMMWRMQCSVPPRTPTSSTVDRPIYRNIYAATATQHYTNANAATVLLWLCCSVPNRTIFVRNVVSPDCTLFPTGCDGDSVTNIYHIPSIGVRSC